MECGTLLLGLAVGTGIRDERASDWGVQGRIVAAWVIAVAAVFTVLLYLTMAAVTL